MNKKSKSGKGRLLKVVFIFVIAIAIAPFILTSSFIVNSVIIPKVSEATGYTIVAGIDISLLNSEVTVSDIIISGGKELNLRGKNIFCAYDLARIFSGAIAISKLELDDVSLELTEVANASFSDDGMMHRKPGEEVDVVSAHAESSLPSLQLRDISISNFNLIYKSLTGQEIELKDFSLMLDQLGQGAKSNLSYAGQLNVDYGAAMTFSSEALQGSLIFQADDNLFPQHLAFETSFKQITGSIQETTISGRDFGVKIEADHKEQAFVIREFAFTENVGPKVNSKISMSGQVVMNPLAVQLDVAVLPISTEMLNLAGSLGGGYSFGNSNIYYKGSIDYQDGMRAEAKGKLFINDFSVALPHRGALDLPLIDFTLEHDISLDFKKEELVLSNFAVNGLSGTDKLIEIKLENPGRIAYGDNKSKLSDSPPRITASVDGLGVQVINQFIPENLAFEVDKGVLNVKSIVTAGQGGRAVDIQVLAEVDRLALKYDKLDFKKLNFKTDISISLKDMSSIEVKRLSASLIENNKSVLKLNAQGESDFRSQSGRVQTTLSVINGGLIQDVADHFSNDDLVSQALQTFSSTALNMGTSLDFNLKQNSLALKRVSVNLSKGKQKIVSLRNLESIPIDLKLFDFSAQPMDLKLDIDSFELSQLNSFIGEKNKSAVLSGNLNADIRLIKDTSPDISSKGQLHIDGLSFIAQGKHLGLLHVKQDFDLRLKANKELVIKSSHLELEANGRKSGLASSNGTYDLEGKSGSLVVSLDGINQNILTGIRGIAKEMPLKTFNLKGKTMVKIEPGSEVIALTGKLICRGLGFEANRGFNDQGKYDIGCSYNVEQGNAGVTINKVKIQLQKEKQMIMDSHVSGTVSIPVGTGVSRLFIGSKKIDLDELSAMLKPQAVNTTRNQKSPDESRHGIHAEESIFAAEEPMPIDLGGLDLHLGLDLKHLLYGGMVNGAKGEIIVRKNIVQMKPMTISIDGVPVELRSSVNLGEKNGYSYSLIGGGDDISLTNALKNIVGKTAHDPSLVISTLAIDLKGKGMTLPNVKKHLHATMGLGLKNVSLPVEVRDTQHKVFGPIFGVMFGALESLGSVVGQLPSSTGSHFHNLTAVMNQKKNLEFKGGKIAIKAENGRLKIEQVELDGDDIEKMSFSGEVGFDNSLNMDTFIDLGIIEIPLPVSGTVDNPHFDTTKFLSQFVAGNLEKVKDGAVDILTSPEKIFDILEDKNKRKQVIDDLFGGFLKQKKRK